MIEAATFVELVDDDDPEAHRRYTPQRVTSSADGRARPVRNGAKRRSRRPAEQVVYYDVEPFDDFAKRARMGVATLTTLAEAGALTKEMRLSGGKWRRYIVEKGIERPEIWTGFLAKHIRPTTFAVFASVVRVAEALRIPGDFEWPDDFADAALDMLEAQGLPQTEMEFHGLVRGEGKTISRVFKAAVARRGKPVRRFHPHSRPKASVAEFRAAMSAIDGLEGTVLEHSDEVVERMVDASMRGAVNAIPDPLVRNMAGLYVVLKTGSVTYHWQQMVVYYLSIAAEVLAAVDKKDAVAVDKVLRRYAFSSRLGWADGDPTRQLVAECWLTASNLWKAHSESFRVSRKRLRAAMPAFPHLVTHLAVDLRRNRRRLRRAAGKGRRGRTLVVAEMRDETEVALKARMTQVDRWTDEFVVRKDALEKDGRRRSIRYSFVEDVVPQNGMPDGSTQVVTCEAMRVGALRARLIKGAEKKQLLRLRAYDSGGKEHDAAGDEVIACVFHAVRPAEGSTGPAVTPAFVRLHGHGLLMNPTRLTAAKQEERAELHRRWRLPSWTYSPQDLLVPFEGAADVIAGLALRQDVIVLHLEPYRHAMRYGHLAGRLGLRNGVRSGETLQLRWQKSGFGFARSDGAVRVGFRAVPKGWGAKQRLFILDDRTFVAANDLVRLTIRRFHPERAVMSLPRREVATLRRTGNMVVHAVFQGLNGMLDASDLNQFYRLLMAGQPPAVMHDLRHVYATVAYDDGIDLPDISDLLSQEVGSLAGYYAAADQRLRVARENDIHKRQDERMALA